MTCFGIQIGIILKLLNVNYALYVGHYHVIDSNLDLTNYCSIIVGHIMMLRANKPGMSEFSHSI